MSELILRAKDVTKSYQQAQTEIRVLHSLTLDVNKGETVAILGQSGSGKSTLLSILSGLDRPNQGSITLVNQDLNLLSEAELTKFRGEHLGIIFQQFHLMTGFTALENVALPLEIGGDPKASSKAAEALEAVGLGHRLNHLPHQLSGGECQRIAIARAFVVQPRLLLADEPSGNLDLETGRKVMDLLFDSVKVRNMTMILVTHDRALASRCARQLILENGQLIPIEASI